MASIGAVTLWLQLCSLHDEVVTPFGEFAGQACESAMCDVEGTQR